MTNRLTERLLSEVPMVMEPALVALCNQGGRLAEPPGLAKLREAFAPEARVTEDGVAIVPIRGTLARRPNVLELLLGIEDTAKVHDLFLSLAEDDQVRAFVLDVDSPGGFMTGGPELADDVRRVTKTKPVVAWTGGTMASLAYWIGSQASRVMATRSAQVGSIGAFAALYDYSAFFNSAGVKLELFRNAEADYKAIGVPGSSLSDAQRDYLRERVQKAFNEFRNDVTRARHVQEDYFRAQVVNGGEALQAGLVDRVGSLQQATRLALFLSRENARNKA